MNYTPVSELKGKNLNLFQETLVEQQITNIKNWIEALRSGRFTQSSETYMLKKYVREDSKVYYCCLGVASVACKLPEAKRSAVLAKTFRAYGLNSQNGKNDFYSLMDMNDCGRYSFDDIADFMEDQLQFSTRQLLD